MNNAITRTFGSVKYYFVKNAPEILIGAGAVGVVTSAVMACKATTKFNEMRKQRNGDIQEIKNALENPELMETLNYTEQDAKKDILSLKIRKGIDFVKCYALPIAAGTFSMGCILKSHRILQNRNSMLGAAYIGVDTAYKGLKKRLREYLGEEKAKEIEYGIKEEKVKESVTDKKTGEVKEKEVTKKVSTVHNGDLGPYSFIFDETNNNWVKNGAADYTWLMAQCAYVNNLLQVKRYLFLNDVLVILGMKPVKYGQMAGWIINKHHQKGDTSIDFFKDIDVTALKTGEENCIWLNFNCCDILNEFEEAADR